MEQSFALPGRAVHVWYIASPPDLPDDVAARYLVLLTAEERARHKRLMQAKDRCQYVLGKVLVRRLLSRYFSLAPEKWLFASNRFGKPVLANAPPGSTVHFNLSHADGLVACAVARDFEVGIDVENTGRFVNLDIARRYFAPSEVAYLEEVPEDQRQATFFRFWTLKEAYVKARGIGLSLPLEQFAFCLQDLAVPRITFEPAMREDPARWRFFLPDVSSPVHQVAVAVPCGQGAAFDLNIQAMEL